MQATGEVLLCTWWWSTTGANHTWRVIVFTCASLCYRH